MNKPIRTKFSGEIKGRNSGPVTPDSTSSIEHPEWNVAPVYIAPDTRELISRLTIDLTNELPGLPLQRQIECAREHMREALTSSDALGYTFGRLVGGSTDAVFIDGLPVFDGSAATALYRTLALMLGSPVGSPFQYVQQHDGTLVPMLEPKIGGAANSNATSAHFGAHTDDAAVPYPFRVRHISLLGEINESGAQTGYAPVDKIVAGLSDEHVEALERDDYLFRLPVSFDRREGQSEWSRPSPILFRDDHGRLKVQCPTYSTEIVVGAPPIVREAFDALVARVEISMRWFTIDTGSYLIFSNDRGLHSRKAIGTGQRRVYRTYWHPNLDAMRAVVGGEDNVFDVDDLQRAA